MSLMLRTVVLCLVCSTSGIVVGNVSTGSKTSESENSNKTFRGLFGPDVPPYLNTVKGLIITCSVGLSIVCLFVRLLIQGCVPVYRRSYGWQQFSLVGAMFIGQGGYLAGKYLSSYHWPCFAVGIASQWGFLVSFLWLNVIALDTMRAFSYSFFGQMKELTAYVMYAFYATAIPSFIVGIPIIFYFDKDRTWSANFDLFKPNYWTCGIDMTNPYFVSTFICAPLAVVLFLNTFIYIYSVKKLNTSLKHNITAAKTGRERGIVTFTVLLIFNAVTWGLAVLYGFFPQDFIEYIFIGFLSLQGLFIFVANVLTISCACKKRKTNSNGNAGSRSDLGSTDNSISNNPMGEKGAVQMVSISSLNSLSHSHSKFVKANNNNGT